MKPSYLLVLSLSLAACSIDQTAASNDDARQSHLTNNQVTAQRVPEGIRVTNGSSVAIRYLVKNPAWLGLLAGCNNEPNSCATLGVGQSAVVPAASIYGHAPDASPLEVWYWVTNASDAVGTSIQVH